MASDLRSYTVKVFEQSVEALLKDVDALSHEDLSRSFGQGSRCAYDLAYEVGVINQRIAFRCRGEDPGPMPWKFGEEWLQAPAEFRTKDAIRDHVSATAKELLASTGEDFERVVMVGEDAAPLYQRVNFATLHTMYHDAQLNFIQSMVGDLTVHW